MQLYKVTPQVHFGWNGTGERNEMTTGESHSVIYFSHIFHPSFASPVIIVLL